MESPYKTLHLGGGRPNGDSAAHNPKKEQLPDGMSEEELKDLFTSNHKLLPEPMWPTGALNKIRDGLVLRSDWGLNPKNVRLSDFEIVVAVISGDFRTGTDGSGKKVTVGVHDQIQIGFKYPQTRRIIAVDADLIDSHGAYPTAGELINLAKPEE